MRLIAFLGMMFVLFAALAEPSSAQTLKSDPKDPPKDEIKWPKEIQGKSLELWVRTMRESKDASTRDQAIRIIPFFGPASRQAVGRNLIDVIKTDPDLNVSLTAVATIPLIGFDDQYVDEGISVLLGVLRSPTAANHTKFETTMAIGSCGPIFKRAIPTIVEVTLIDQKSWQNRKAAATALGSLGQPTTKDDGPDPQAIRGLIRTLKFDTSHQVRREAINALMVLGPPKIEAIWKELRLALTEAWTKETDKSIALWARVAYVRTEQDLIKPTDPNLVAITKLLASPDQTLKQEAIQALGVIGEEAKSRVPELIAIVEGKNEEPIVIATAIWALSQIPSETAKTLPVINSFRRAQDNTIKAAAETAYRTLTDKPDPDKKKDAPPKS